METTKRHLTLFVALILFLFTANAMSQSRCSLNGTYRIDVSESDRLYSLVRSARSSVPFSDQQEFFLDLSTRLTPPDLVTIECQGNRVSVGSSRASKITYLADGKNRRERSPTGGIVNSRVTLKGDSLKFVSIGNVDDNVNVAFESVDDGARMLVTRRIYAKQLAEPIVIRTFYDKIASQVDWKLYDGDLVASTQPVPSVPARVTTADRNGSTEADVLRSRLMSWIEATNSRDIDQQMTFYMPQLKAYYLTRNTPRRAVRAEKEKVFGAVRAVDIRAGDPEIVFTDSGFTAIMRFRKEYRVAERTRIKQGVVIQELRWQRTPGGWMITSERDVRVIR